MNSVQMQSAINSINSTANAIDANSMLNSITAAADLNYHRSQVEAQKTRDWQEQQNAKAMQFNSEQAQINRDWQKMMSDTAHQREVRDLLNAGLNPILSASGGNGASTTSGATASGVTSSGATASPDSSLNNAMASLFNSLFNSVTSMANASTSALSNLAVAEKNNATSKLVTSMNNNTALQVAKEQANASRYGSDTQAYIAKNYPNSMPALLDRYLGAILEGATGSSSTQGSVSKTVDKVLKDDDTGNKLLRLFTFGIKGR